MLNPIFKPPTSTFDPSLAGILPSVPTDRTGRCARLWQRRQNASLRRLSGVMVIHVCGEFWLPCAQMGQELLAETERAYSITH